MDYKVKGKEKNVVTLEITLKMEEWEKEVEASYNRNKGRFNIEGFRKGKAPRKVIEKAYGDQVFYEDALQEGFQKAYMELLSKEKDIEPIDAPDVTIKKFDKDGVAYDYSLNVDPEKPQEEYDEGYKPAVPRAKTLIDKLNQQKTSVQGSEAGIPPTPLANTIGNMVIYSINKDKQQVEVFRAAETISVEKVQETQNILQDMVGKGLPIEKLDVLDNATLIADVRKDGKLIYVDFGK